MNETYDVVVLGSGAAGLTAAYTAANEGAKVAVFEKHTRIGGTTSWSGGWMWVPNNPCMEDLGVQDSADDAVTYLLNQGRGLVDEGIVRAFVEEAPRMVRYLMDHAKLPFYAVTGLPDYHPHHPGGRPEGGRSMGLDLVSFDRLGAWADRVEVSPYYPSHLRGDELGIGKAVPQPPSPEEVARRLERDERGGGVGLVGALLEACLSAGVTIMTESRGVRLLRDDAGVTGVTLQTPDGERDVLARHGVILATGGFDWNEEYRRTFLRGPVHKPASIPTNTGDGLTMAMRLGAALQNMREAWWIPITVLPPGINAMDLDMINADRTRPRSIMVNGKGERYTNEAADYNSIGGAFYQEDVNSFDYANLPTWVIIDHTNLTRYGSRGTPFDGTTPPWLTESPTIAGLGERLGLPPGSLERTVRRWNEQVAAGRDDDFHRGESAHDRWWGDPYRKGHLEGTLGPIADGPFYAMELKPGIIGTKGGPKVDTRARVIDLEGDAIPHLYAVGNASSPTGTGYGGVGGTLGPAMTWGWVAGRDAAAQREAVTR